MAARLIWLPEAGDDLDAIASHIAQDAPGYAADMVERVLVRAQTLLEFPRSGHVTPEIGAEDVRELSVYPYRVVYCLREEVIVIVAVLHGSRRIEDLLRRRGVEG